MALAIVLTWSGPRLRYSRSREEPNSQEDYLSITVRFSVSIRVKGPPIIGPLQVFPERPST
ncbi:uncharacterized protein G2W53_009142 [Senna tora]|uniref:Uncharacterized protein n=1 Tax=Senna tora TaxID=362788 RepID=A0A834WYG2_9FABA|nr:uncharacterized protein G2W53_009142 [Senna tora]